VRPGTVRLYGTKVKALRREYGIKIPALAAECSVADKTIQNAEAGRPITLERAQLIARALRTTVVDLTMEKVPSVSWLDGQESQALLDVSFDCYLELFPQPTERDDPDDIRCWLQHARLAAVNGSKWREAYAVLHVDSEAIGMAYLSGHVQRPYWFGNYFGVRQDWPRQEDRSHDFLKNKIVPHLTTMVPGSRAILFEIETFDFDYLEDVARRERLAGYGDEKKLCTCLYQLERLRFYSMRGALAAVKPNGRPMPYWQPALQRPLERQGECELILMMYSFDQKPENLNLEDIINFLYDDLYTNAYDGTSTVELPNYAAYVRTVKARVVAGLAECTIKTLMMPRQIRGLVARARQEGLCLRPSEDQQ
jgi:transcriptional regulator with XRE-family HTH domain